MRTLTAEQALLRTGDFDVDQKGHVWRVRERGRPCDHRRAEHRVPRGYLQVRRMIDGTRLHLGAHRVVWTHCNGPIPPGREVNHRDGIKDDNRPENLELSNPSHNARHAHRGGLRDQSGEKNPAAKLTDRQVAQIRLAYEQGGYTQAELARKEKAPKALG